VRRSPCRSPRDGDRPTRPGHGSVTTRHPWGGSRVEHTFDG
jgi:hypothetical protein